MTDKQQLTRKLTAEEKAELRRQAVLRVFAGEPAIEVTRSYGLGPKTIFKWIKTAKEQGLDALAPIPRSGRNRTLKKADEQTLSRWLFLQTPKDFGFDQAFWNRDAVRQLVSKEMNIDLSVSTVHRVLHRINVAPQKDICTTKYSDNKAIREWSETQYPEIQKLAKRNNAQIYWLVENNDLPESVKQALKDRDEDPEDYQFLAVVSNRGAFMYRQVRKNNFISEMQRFISDFVELNDNLIYIVADQYMLESASVLTRAISFGEERVQVFHVPHGIEHTSVEVA